jgi:tRNA modification GTPase
MNAATLQDTICAVSTPAGTGGIAVIRVSGVEAFAICDSLFVPQNRNRSLATQAAHTVTYGSILRDGEALDDVLATVFRAPHSFTGEDTVEIACHGSAYIQQQILQLLIDRGCRSAQPGEFTQRAFLNGKIDLSQAEAVADLIASTSAGMHKLAMSQMRGGFSAELAQLRAQLLEFTSLIELELDFSGEDVTFADRAQLQLLAQTIHRKITRLTDSFSAGNVIKNGIPVAIIGAPNVGKSTLLNALLNEERAIVSDIPGTTRDTIEETLSIGGQLFRFIDTAGLRRHTTDPVEALGIRRSFEKAEKAAIILYLFDLTEEDADDPVTTSQWLQRLRKPVLMIGTKNDLACRSPIHTSGSVVSMYVSCREPADVERIKQEITVMANLPSVGTNDVIVTNVRHYEALCGAQSAIVRVMEGLADGLSGDFLSQDIRECIHYLGEITGEISTEDILGNIFSRFCIGK